MPKSVPKSIQTCFRVIFSKKIYARCSMEDRVFENFQKFFFSKFQKCPKLFHKRIQTCFELVLGQIFRNFFCPVFRGGSIFRKFSKKYFFKIPKMPKSVPKSIQTCFSVIFSKKIYAQCSMEGRVFENFQFFSKFQKGPKSFTKESKRVFNLFWVKFFENFFAQCSVEGRVFENFQKKKIQNSKNAQKCSQKSPNMF